MCISRGGRYQVWRSCSWCWKGRTWSSANRLFHSKSFPNVELYVLIFRRSFVHTKPTGRSLCVRWSQRLDVIVQHLVATFKQLYIDRPLFSLIVLSKSCRTSMGIVFFTGHVREVMSSQGFFQNCCWLTDSLTVVGFSTKLVWLSLFLTCGQQRWPVLNSRCFLHNMLRL